MLAAPVISISITPRRLLDTASRRRSPALSAEARLLEARACFHVTDTAALSRGAEYFADLPPDMFRGARAPRATNNYFRHCAAGTADAAAIISMTPDGRLIVRLLALFDFAATPSRRCRRLFLAEAGAAEALRAGKGSPTMISIASKDGR